MTRKRAVRWLSLATFGVTLVMAHACSTDVRRGGDSESHFLSNCGATCGGGLSCICGVCTRLCGSTNECSGLGERAECAAVLEPSCAGVGKACDVACLSDDACNGRGQGFACVDGRCRISSGRADASSGAAGGAGTPTAEAGNGGANGSGGTSASGGTNAEGCAHTTYPSAPSGAVAGGPDLEFVSVQYSADLGDGPPNADPPSTRYAGLGFDLDLQCTTADLRLSAAECQVPGSGAIDGPGGTDNAFGKVVQFLRDHIIDFSSAAYSQQLQLGTSNLAIHVTGYNGQVDDGEVRVELFPDVRSSAYVPRDSGTTAAPKWNGTDAFAVSSEGTINGDRTRARFVDQNGYVSGGKLVASFLTASARLSFVMTPAVTTVMDLPFHGAVLVCDVTPTTDGFWGFTADNCTLAGRLSADDLVHQLFQFPDPVALPNFTALCNVSDHSSSSTSYLLFKNSICSARDALTGVPGHDAPCDGLSVGLTFTAKPARLGDVFQPNPVENPCALSADPEKDSCTPPVPDAG